MLKRSLKPIVILIFLIIVILAPGQNTLLAEKYILLVDQSGSLIKNDPHDFRKEALKLFLDQIPRDGKVALFSFGEGAYEYNRKGELFFPIKDNDEWFREKLDGLGRSDRITDLRDGLEKVLINTIGDKEEKILFIFTDSQLKKNDIPGNVTLGNYLKDIYELSRKLNKNKVTIYGLAFTQSADISYLEDIASITNGKAIKAQYAINAGESIINLMNNIIRGPVIIQNEVTKKINIDNTIRSFAIWAFNRDLDSNLPKITLIKPNSKLDTNHTINRYNYAITLIKNNPVPGIWKAKISGIKNKNDVNIKYYSTKKVNFDIIYHSPKAKDLIVTRGSPVNIDIELKNINKGALENIKSTISLLDKDQKVIAKKTLAKEGQSFLGSLNTDDLQPGTYYISSVISTRHDQIKRKFILHIKEVEKKIITGIDISKDIVIGNSNPIIVEKDPDLPEANFSLIVTKPNNKEKEFSLYNDGQAEHGDAVAGDNKYGNILDCFNSDGVYKITVSSEYTKNGMPVLNKETLQIIKAIEIKPDLIDIKYPQKKNWQLKKIISLDNKTNYKIILQDISLHELDKTIDLSLQQNQLVINPRSKKEIEIKFKGKNFPKSKDGRYTAIIDCDIPKYAQNMEAGIDIRFQQSLSTKSIIILAILFFIIIAVILVVTGIYAVTPARFKNKMFYDELTGDDYHLHGELQMKTNILPYIKLNNEIKIGITLFGYGYWYKEDPDTGDIKRGFDNINELMIKQDMI